MWTIFHILIINIQQRNNKPCRLSPSYIHLNTVLYVSCWIFTFVLSPVVLFLWRFLFHFFPFFLVVLFLWFNLLLSVNYLKILSSLFLYYFTPAIPVLSLLASFQLLLLLYFFQFSEVIISSILFSLAFFQNTYT